MNLSRVRRLLWGDVTRGTRSPLILWLVVMPFALTLLLKVVFAALLETTPRIGLLDRGSSAVSESLLASNDIQAIGLTSVDQMARKLEYGDLDAGLVLQGDFDSSLVAGTRPLLDISFSRMSGPEERIVILLTVLDFVRKTVPGGGSPFRVIVHSENDEEDMSLLDRLLPAVILMVLMVTGIFLPAYLLVHEKENGTIFALLVTPTSISEIISSKVVLGFILTVVISAITLLMNGGFRWSAPAIILTLMAGAFLCNSVGIIYAALSRDTKTLYTLVKSLNVLLAGPVIFYLVPDLPQWIAKIFPTYWFIDPLYRATLHGADLVSVLPELAATLILAMLFMAWGRKMLIRDLLIRND